MEPEHHVERLARAEIPIISLRMARGRADARAFLRAVPLLRAWPAACAVNWMYHAVIFGRLAARAAGIPRVVSSLRSGVIGAPSRRWAVRLTNGLDTVTTTNSALAAAAFRAAGQVDPRKLQVIPNALDPHAFDPPVPGLRAATRAALGIAPEEFVWLAVGRLEKPKDYPLLVAAVAHLPDSTHRLLIAGDGSLRHDLVERIAAAGMQDRITLLGRREDIPALLDACDAYVLSSAWEGLPNGLMEAMAMRRPVVAADVGGVRELVRPGEGGFVVAGRDPRAYAQAMTRMMGLGAEERRALGEAGAAHMACSYELERVVDLWEAAIRGPGHLSAETRV
jgi:glycosyltransferase involved in cell wall biosynthesis